MTLPIYQSDSHQLPEMTQANKGLRFERFFNQYRLNENEIKPKDEDKANFLGKFKGSCGNTASLDNYTKKQFSLAQSLGGDGKVYSLDWHLVTGMGNSHPVENGFLWHHTLGVPYIPGSQVKGIIRSLLEQYLGEEDAEKKEYKDKLLFEWFGSGEKGQGNDTQAGRFIFFDAIPVNTPKLSVDIMTPHMGKWYAEGGNICNIADDADKIPADWHDPIPIPFLAVKEANFLFTIAERNNPNQKGTIGEVSDVWEKLGEALEYLGAGAKTQTGYGYMTFNTKATDDLLNTIKEKEIEVEAKKKLDFEKENVSKLHAELLDTIAINRWRDTNDKAKQHFTEALKGQWLEKLENNIKDQACIRLMLEIAHIHYPIQLKNPKHKKVKPNQRVWIEKLLSLIEDQTP